MMKTAIREEDIRLGVGSTILGGLAIHKATPMITGRTRLYHGTSPKLVEKILKTGIRPAVKTNVSGITDALASDIIGKAKKLVYLTPSKGEARDYAHQAEKLLEQLSKGRDPNSAAWIIQKDMEVNPLSYMFKRKGVMKVDVPLWKKDIASRLVKNPEAKKSFEEFHKGTQGLIEDPKFIKWMKRRSLLKSKVFEEGIDPKYIKGSKFFKKISPKEIFTYIKAKPGKFVTGAGLGILGLGTIGFGVNKLLNIKKESEYNNMKTPLLDGVKKADLRDVGAILCGGIPGIISKRQKEKGIGAGTSALTGAGIGLASGIPISLITKAVIKKMGMGDIVPVMNPLNTAVLGGVTGGAQGLIGRLFAKKPEEETK